MSVTAVTTSKVKARSPNSCGLCPKKTRTELRSTTARDQSIFPQRVSQYSTTNELIARSSNRCQSRKLNQAARDRIWLTRVPAWSETRSLQPQIGQESKVAS